MVAVICNSPVQLMRAVYLALHKIDPVNDVADLYIGAGCPNGKELYFSISRMGLFQNVYYAEAKSLGKHPVFRLLYGKAQLSEVVQRERYQRLVAFNIEDAIGQAIYNANKGNMDFEYHCIEDAPAIYSLYEPRRYKVWHPYYWMKIEQQAYHIKKWWCSCPDLIYVPESFTTEKDKLALIDKTDQDYLRLVNEIFEYEEDEKLANADVLIMEEGHYTDGLMMQNADYELFTRIRERYPSKNIMVKLHPRTKDDRFSKNFEVMEKASIPWELHVLNRLYKNRKSLIQISIACGTMVSDKLMFGEEGKKIILAPIFYDLVKASNGGVKRITPEITEGFEKIRNTYSRPENFVIAHDEKEVFANMDVMLNNNTDAIGGENNE